MDKERIKELSRWITSEIDEFSESKEWCKDGPLLTEEVISALILVLQKSNNDQLCQS